MHAWMNSSRFPGAFAAGASFGSGAVGSGSPGCFTERHSRPPCLPMCTRSVWLSIITGAGSVSPPAGGLAVDEAFCTAPPVSFFHVSRTPLGGLKQSASVSPAYWISFGQSRYGPISTFRAGSMLRCVQMPR